MHDNNVNTGRSFRADNDIDDDHDGHGDGDDNDDDYQLDQAMGRRTENT